MGYPMSYGRVVNRNGLTGGYDAGLIQGDLRRLEDDQRDDRHLEEYAAAAGITPAQAKLVLDAFFGFEKQPAKTVTKVENEPGKEGSPPKIS